MRRDVVIHSVIAAVGGTLPHDYLMTCSLGWTAAIAYPAMGPIMDTVVSTFKFGDSVVVELGVSCCINEPLDI